MGKKRKTDRDIESKIAKRHVEIFQKRQQELKDNPLRDLPSLVKQMREMREFLDGLPEGQIYGEDGIEALDDCRLECHSLKCAVEDILEEVNHD